MYTSIENNHNHLCNNINFKKVQVIFTRTIATFLLGNYR